MKLLIALLILIMLSPLAHADHIAGRILVTLQNAGDAPRVAARMKARGTGTGAWKRLGKGRSIILHTPKGAEREAMAQAVREGNVVAAELDELCPPADITPNDPYYVNQWHHPNISMPSAWTFSTGANSVIIAICDTGCDPTHPDLLPNYVPGWNVVSNTSDTSDIHGHGTHVAGTAGAVGNNAIGVSGVCWNVGVMPMRVTNDSTGYASFSAMANAVYWATDHGARVANISFSNAAGSSTIHAAGQYLYERGGLLCIAAGNTGGFLSYAPNTYTVVVASTGGNNSRSSFSSYGAFVDLCAPGENIWSTRRGGGYGGGSGTSFASPVVAGVAALLYAASPLLTSSQVRDILYSTADDLGVAGRDDYYGWGKVNAGRALANALTPPPVVDDIPPTVRFLSPKNGARIRKQKVTVEVEATDNVGVSQVSLSFDGRELGSLPFPPYVWVFAPDDFSPGTHTFRATAKDTTGNTRSASVSVTK